MPRSLSEGQPRQDREFLCSTAGLPPRARAARWHDAIQTPYPGLAVDWLTRRPIEARLESRPFADARITEIRNTPVRVTYTPSLAAPSGYQLVLHVAGNGYYAHNGRDVVQEPGDLVLLDTALPFVSVFNADFRILIWDLPREALLPLLAAPERAIALRICGDHGVGAVLAAYTRMLARESGRMDATAQQSLRLHLCSLAALAVGASQPLREARRIAYRTARRQQVLAYIEAHFRDGRVNAKHAASELKMSRRWLHALFDGSDTSFAACLTRRRVEECRKLLADPAQDERSIAEIAFGCGFDELSTFNRQFRAYYRMAPREARQVRLSSSPAFESNSADR